MKNISKKILLSLIMTSMLLGNTTMDKDSIIDIEFKKTKLSDFIDIVSKIENKNILVEADIDNKTIDFVTNKKIKESEIMDVFISILNSKNLTLLKTPYYYKIVDTKNLNQENIPLLTNKVDIESPLIRTELIPLTNINPDILIQKIRVFLSQGTKIVPIKEKKVVLVTGLPDEINNLKKIINILDIDNGKKYELVKLNNQKVDDIAVILNSAATKIDDKINEIQADFFVDKNSNSIGIIGNEEIIKKYKELTLKLDTEESKTEEKIELIFLKNSVSVDMAKILNDIISKKVTTEIPNSLSVPKTIISVDEEMNALIVVGIDFEIKKIKSLVEKLDIPRQQVYVKTTIVEIKKEDIDKVGAKYGLEAGYLTDNTLFSLGTTLTGSAIASSLLPINVPDNLTKGMAVGLSLDLLKKNNVLDVLSEPSILCINNRESEVNVAETISVLKSTQTPDVGGTIRSYDRTDIGILLKVKPVLSTDNKVSLDVNAKLEGIVSLGAEIGTPTTTKREVKTTAIVSDGEPVIIGGLIKTDNNVIETKVPILGDLPLIGNLFTSVEKTENKTNLVIILTPYIIKQSSDLTDLRNKLAELDLIQKDYNNKMQLKIDEEMAKKTKSTKAIKNDDLENKNIENNLEKVEY